MALTIPQIEATSPEQLTAAAAQVARSALADGSHVDTQQRVISALQDGWQGAAADGAVDGARRMLVRQQLLHDKLTQLRTALQSGGDQLTATRSAIVGAVTQLEGQGWQVSPDGTVGVRPGSPLEQLAKMSPVSRMVIEQLAASANATVKQLLADFESQDAALAKAIRDALNGVEEKDEPGGGQPTTPGGQPETPAGQNGAQVAENYLGRNAEELKKSGDLPMDPSIPSDICCANFVTASLQQAGLIDWHSNGVADTSTRLQQQGWRVVSAAEAPPGAVAVINGNGHIELVHGNDNGNITLIGSNNVNADGTQQVSYGHPYGNVVYLAPP